MWESNVENSWGNPPQNLFWSHSHLPQKQRDTLRQMYRTVWGTLQRTFWEAKAICCKEPQKTNVSFCPKTFAMAEDPKAKSVQKDARKSWRNWETNVKKWWGTFCRTFPKRKGSAPEDQKRSRNLRNLRETLVEPSQNLLAAQDEPLGSPRRICPREPETLRNLENLGGTFWQPKTDLAQRTRDTTKLGEAWWNLGGTFVKPWWNLGETLVNPWRNLGGTLAEPSAEPWWNLARNLLAAQDGSAPRNLENLGGTLVNPWRNLGGTWWNLPRNLLAAQDGSCSENQRHHETWRRLVEPWWNLGESLAEPWRNLPRNLGGTLRGTFWQPKTDLPQRTIESPKAILPRSLYYGWRPQNYCCWEKKTVVLLLCVYQKTHHWHLKQRNGPISPADCSR